MFLFLSDMLAQRRKLAAELAALDRKIEREALRLAKAAGSGKSTGKGLIDCSMFKDTTRRLLEEFQKAPDHILTHEDIRQDVMFDEYASDPAVWMVIKRARQEMVGNGDFPYEIKSLSKKRYQLVEVNILTKPNKPPKSLQKQGKKDARVC